MHTKLDRLPIKSDKSRIPDLSLLSNDELNRLLDLTRKVSDPLTGRLQRDKINELLTEDEQAELMQILGRGLINSRPMSAFGQ